MSEPPEGPYWHDVDLGDLTADQRLRLDQVLRAEQIPATWGGTRLRVDTAFQARLDTLIGEVRAATSVTTPPPQYPPPPYAMAPTGPAPYAMAPTGYVTPTATNSLAVVSLVLGVLSLMACAVTGPPGLYCGVRARREIRASGQSGDGLALAGIITSAVGTFVLGVALVALVAIVAIALASSG